MREELKYIGISISPTRFRSLSAATTVRVRTPSEGAPSEAALLSSLLISPCASHHPPRLTWKRPPQCSADTTKCCVFRFFPMLSEILHNDSLHLRLRDGCGDTYLQGSSVVCNVGHSSDIAHAVGLLPSFVPIALFDQVSNSDLRFIEGRLVGALS